MSKRKTRSARNYYGKWNDRPPRFKVKKLRNSHTAYSKLRRSVDLLDSTYAMCEHYYEKISNNDDLLESKKQGKIAINRLRDQVGQSQNLLRIVQRKKNFKSSHKKTIHHLSKKIDYYTNLLQE